MFFKKIKDVHKVESEHRKFLDWLNKDPKSSDMAKSFFKSQIYTCKSWINASQNINRNLCESISLINDCGHLFQGIGPINVMTKENYDMMLPTEVLHKYYNLHKYPEIVKQRSQLWFEMHKKARITASTCFKGIGLGLL